MHNFALELAHQPGQEEASLAMFRQSSDLYTRRHGGEVDYVSLTAQGWMLHALKRCGEAKDVLGNGECVRAVLPCRPCFA